MCTSGRAGMGFYIMQTGGEPAVSHPPHPMAKSAAQTHQRWDRLHHGRERREIPAQTFKEQPKPIPCLHSGPAAPSPRGLGQPCHSTLGIMRDFRHFGGVSHPTV